MRVAVESSVLRWALQRSGRQAAIESKYPQVSRWLQNEAQPTLRQLEHLAKATATPLGYFLLPEPPEDRLPIPHFRTVGAEAPSEASPDLLETVYTMQRRQAWLREYLTEEGNAPLPFVGVANVKDDPQAIAQKLKEILGLQEGWAAEHPTWIAALRHLQRRSEEAGIVVVVNSIVGNNPHRKLNVNEFRGFVLVDAYAPLVFLNSADGKAAQMFTLAHELAHVVLGESAAFDLRDLQPAADAVEQACNRVAAEFLVPREELQAAWARVGDDPDRFQEIARRFKVSELVAARRALDLRLIAKNDFFEFYEAYLEEERRSGKREDGGGNFYRTQHLRIGRRFALAVVRAVRAGRLLYRDAYQLTGLHGETFGRYAEYLVQVEVFWFGLPRLGQGNPRLPAKRYNS